MYVALPHEQKGTHMSRFLEVLNRHTGEPVCPERIPEIARAIRERLEAKEAHFEATFTYFINKPAPVTGHKGMMNYEVTFACTATGGTDAATGGTDVATGGTDVATGGTDVATGEACTAGGATDFVMTVAAPAQSLCPCSKEISEYGAHNQRCRIEASVRTCPPGSGTSGMMWIEDLVEHLEAAASVPVFAVLKRPDEKWVTEKAYENPKFVEDIVRDLAGRLEGDARVEWYSISSENFESIHSHNAYARLTRDKRG